MKEIKLVLSMIVMKVSCSRSYLDSIFDGLVDFKPIKNASNYGKTILDLNPEVLLESKQDDIYEPSKEDLKDYERFLDKLHQSSSQQYPSGSDGSYIDCNLTSRNMNSNYEFDEYVKSFYDKLHWFIQFYVFNSFRNTYIQRLDKIKRITKLICKKKNSEINKTIFVDKIENSCVKILSCLFNKYKLHLKFSADVYNLFSNDIDETFDCFLSVKFMEYEVSTHNNIRERPFILVSEYMEIYKYTTLIPEILSLGYVLVSKPSIKIIVILHLLNLFITKIEGSVEEKGIFIIFFIIKALSCTSKNATNFIESLKIQGNFFCQHPELNFFIWEFKFSQRVTFKNRINLSKKQHIFFNEKDILYYSLILRIFLFQHLIFLKFYDFEYKHYEELMILYDEIMKSKGCYGCHFKQFMYLVRSHFKYI